MKVRLLPPQFFEKLNFPTFPFDLPDPISYH
jgi:hypothetical protein